MSSKNLTAVLNYVNGLNGKPICSIAQRLLREFVLVEPALWPTLVDRNSRFGEALNYYSQFHILEQEVIFGEDVAKKFRQNYLYMLKAKSRYKENGY